MPLAAFVSLEDIAHALPPYREEVVRVEMDDVLKRAYQKLEEEVQEALRKYRGNPSVISVGMNALLLYPGQSLQIGRSLCSTWNCLTASCHSSTPP